jgi:hypothetical protein
MSKHMKMSNSGVISYDSCKFEVKIEMKEVSHNTKRGLECEKVVTLPPSTVQGSQTWRKEVRSMRFQRKINDCWRISGLIMAVVEWWK